MTPFTRPRLSASLCLLIGPAIAAAAPVDEAIPLAEYVISVARAPQETGRLPIAVHVIPGDALGEDLTVDAALRADPAFSLFRRSSSLSANPTAQGVSLRGVGPSGASRTAVLFDSIPLNDPFGGWIVWGQVPTLTLAGAEIAHGGGSGVWGSNALGGTVALASRPLNDSVGAASIQAGSHGLWRAEATQTSRVGAGSIRIDARLEDYDGFYPVLRDQRGAVDRRLSHAHRLAQLSWRHPINRDVDARLTLRYFDEDRGNGTELQENATRLAHAAFSLEGRDGADPIWAASVWGQRQEFSSFFSAVAPDRSSETPANNQHAVPASTVGAQAHRLFRSEGASTVLGGDLRWVEGETREHYFFQNGAFTQARRVGGTQRGAGLFLHHDRALSEVWHLTAAVRADAWANTDGHTLERSLQTGSISRDERHGDRDGVTLSPRLGVSARWARDTTVRAAVYRGFRLPTLNEYYRPFRVGSTSTLANPALAIESLQGLDIGVEHRIGTVSLRAGAFWNIMDDAVGNVTLGSTPGGTTRQRQNIPETRIRGLEASVAWAPHATLSLRVSAFAADAEVTRAPNQPGLEGRQLAQVPEYALRFESTWRPADGTRLSVNGNVHGRQFEDDENQLVLSAATTVAFRIEQRVARSTTCFLQVDNFLDHPAQTGRTAAGLVSYDSPRSVRGGVNLTW